MALSDLLPAVQQLSAPDKRELLRLLIAELSSEDTVAFSSPWQFLVARPHPWRRQLYIKGRRLLASTVWQDLMINLMSPEEAAENWGLPLAAIQEVIQYCATHPSLLTLEAEEEHHRLQEQGVSLAPIAAAG